MAPELSPGIAERAVSTIAFNPLEHAESATMQNAAEAQDRNFTGRGEHVRILNPAHSEETEYHYTETRR